MTVVCLVVKEVLSCRVVPLAGVVRCMCGVVFVRCIVRLCVSVVSTCIMAAAPLALGLLASMNRW